MNSLVVYDSQYGNTKRIAEAIGKSLAPSGKVKVSHVSEVVEQDLSGIEVLFAGSPTQRLTATPAMLGWIKSLAPGSLKGIKAAAFDTRFTEEKINEIRVLAFFVRIFGYGAKPISAGLRKKGAEISLPPTGFFVGDTEGPLLESELERAELWAGQLVSD